jgi:predicted MFS family arabinose efflux permease
MWVAYFLNYCDRQAVFAMFPSLRADLGMTYKQLGLVGTAFLWVYGFGCPIAGQLGDQFSRRVLVALSLVLWSVITIATGFANSAAMMLGLRAVMGITESLYMPTAIALTANAHPPELRSRAIAILTTAQIVGTVAGSWFGGWMADRGLWRDAFLVLGGVGVLYALPYFLFLRTVDEPRETKATTSEEVAIGDLVQVPSFLLMCTTFPVFVFGLWLIYGWFPTFLHNKFSLNQADAAFNATVYLQGATFLGLIAGGFLADALFHRTKAARLWLLVASFVLCAPCLAALGASPSLNATRLAAIGFGLFAGLLQGNIFPAAFEVAPAHTRSSAVGALNFFGAIVSGFATLYGGLWQVTLGMDRLLALTAVAYLGAGILLIVGIRVFFRRDYERIHSPSP